MLAKILIVATVVFCALPAYPQINRSPTMSTLAVVDADALRNPFSLISQSFTISPDCRE
jgi:hypothetical protein